MLVGVTARSIGTVLLLMALSNGFQAGRTIILRRQALLKRIPSVTNCHFLYRCASRLQSSSSSSTNHHSDDDTIFALSSGQITSSATAVSVIRITGPKAHFILEDLITSRQFMPPTRKAVVRTLFDETDGKMPLDQALVLKFDAPFSFTGEDVVELHCHGSRAVLQDVLDRLSGFPHTRLAEPGEFTQRAFGAGKLDLLEVEALADLLKADTQKQRQQALLQLQGNLSTLYQQWRQQLTKGLAHAEAVIDFGDDEQLNDDDNDDDDGVWGAVRDKMECLCGDMVRHLADNRRGELVREGLAIAIVGPPNAGKSSLFNIVAQRDAAIVSPIAGTTRDVLELTLNLGGVRCTLSDTAGVRESTHDAIEKEGMQRARNTASRADIVVAMIDGTNMQEGLNVIKDMVDDRVLLVVNKADLVDSRPENTTLVMSCKTNEGVDLFLSALTERVLERVSDPQTESNDNEGAIITRARHRQHVEAAVEALERFHLLSNQGSMAVDMAAEELRLATSELGRITGAVDVEEVLDVLFADFCIGK